MKLTTISIIFSIIAILAEGYFGVRIALLSPENPILNPRLFFSLVWIPRVFSSIAFLLAIIGYSQPGRKSAFWAALILSLLAICSWLI
ncbi:hypothetical protein D0469_18125 [Peribacillus saganii]|uniref:Uncharacterized protein n=1 Tax=Peribacillus saganii TaxID=2303992 RepID=A0A372LE28_9BACI|nr:hypothetical protein D0469_18125 [Peribacillus saganii]